MQDNIVVSWRPREWFLEDSKRHWAGKPPKFEPNITQSIEQLRVSEWSSLFEVMQRDRLVMGALRYGRIGEKGKPEYDRIESAMRRLKEYRKTGNDEHLVDVANIMLLEFVEGTHPNKHFSSIDEHKMHSEVIS